MGSVVEIYSDASLPMPETLEALARVHIVAEAGGRMRSYPLSTGGVIMLYAAEITEEALKKGRDRLNTRAQTITAKIQATQQIIESMRGRAPEEKVQEKQNELARLQQQLQDIDMSRGLLK